MIYLHIGINKTGSSSIQRALHDNRSALLRHGILYPETGLGNEVEGHRAHLLLSKGLGFANTGLQASETMANAVEFRKRLDHEIAQTRARSVILSSEFFTQRRDMDPVRCFLNGLDVRVVVYLRRHDLWYPSLYAQALKSVHTPPWEPGLEGFVRWKARSKTRYRRFGQMLDAWAGIVGAENILLRPFERVSMKNDLVEDFFDLCGLPIPDEIARKPAPKVNKTPDAALLPLLERVKRSQLSDGLKTFTAKTAFSLPRSSRKLELPPALKEEILAEHAEDYARIARTYLRDPSGILFSQAP